MNLSEQQRLSDEYSCLKEAHFFLKEKYKKYTSMLKIEIGKLQAELSEYHDFKEMLQKRDSQIKGLTRQIENLKKNANYRSRFQALSRRLLEFIQYCRQRGYDIPAHYEAKKLLNTDEMAG